jgi:hypothetical protein
MSDLDEVIRERRSTRMFLPDPVPRHLVDEAVELAMRAPSNSNMQPWDLVFASGAARVGWAKPCSWRQKASRRWCLRCLRPLRTCAVNWVSGCSYRHCFSR